MYFALVCTLFFVIGFQLLHRIFLTIRSGSYLRYSDPRFIIALILSYYVFGGFISAIDHSWIDRIDHWPYVLSSLIVLSVFYNSLCLGYRSTARKVNYLEGLITESHSSSFLPKSNVSSLIKLSILLSFLGFSLFLIGSGGNLIQYFLILKTESEQVLKPEALYDGGFSNYLKYSLDLAMYGSVMLITLFLRLKSSFYHRLTKAFRVDKRVSVLVLIGLFVSITFFVVSTFLGFRFRIAVLFISILLSFVLSCRRLPSKFFISVSLSLLLLYASLVGIGRNYGRGIEVNRLEGVNSSEIFFRAFQESRVFHISGAAIAFSYEQDYRVGLAPIIGAITRPIPRKFLPNKINYTYLYDLYYSIYRSEGYMKSVASLVYAEMYVMYGLVSVLILSFLVGLMLSRARLWLFENIDDIGVIVLYALLQGWLYIFLTRTIPQSFQFLFFIVLIPYFFWRIQKSVHLKF